MAFLSNLSLDLNWFPFTLFTATTKTLILFGLLFWSHSAACACRIDLNSLTRDQAVPPAHYWQRATCPLDHRKSSKTLLFIWLVLYFHRTWHCSPGALPMNAYMYECIYMNSYICIYIYLQPIRYACTWGHVHPHCDLWTVASGSSVMELSTRLMSG